MGILVSWIILSLSVWITAAILPGFRLRSPGSAFGVAAIFGVLDFLLGWVLFVVLALGTLGIGLVLAFITRWIVNAILLKLTDAFTDALTIDGFKWALGGAAMMSIIGTVGEALVRGLF